MKNFLIILSSVAIFSACKKYEEPPGASSLTLFNSVIGSNSLVTNFKGTSAINYSNARKVDYGVFHVSYRFARRPGQEKLGLFNFPDTLSSDLPLYLMDIDLPLGAIQTLFLTGLKDDPEYLLINESFPILHRADSVMGLRLLNLSPRSSAIRVEIQGVETQELVNNLNYKNYTDFIQIPVKNDAPNYTIKVYDSETNHLISQLPLNGIGNNGAQTGNIWRNHFFSIVFIGDPIDTMNYPQKLVLISHTSRN